MEDRVLVMGAFSLEKGRATAGDLMAREVVCDWLRAAGQEFDVALELPFQHGVNWRKVDPKLYTDFLYVCGPFADYEVSREFLDRFAHCRKIGINLSMMKRVDVWNPFDFLLERDSSAATIPDISLVCEQKKVPVVGLMLVHPQLEYGARAKHDIANQAIQRLINSREIAVVEIDTRLDKNSSSLRTAAEVESLVARMDIVLTTRLHGLVLAIKNGVPAIAVDAIAGGAKVTRQAQSLGWTIHFNAEFVTDAQLQAAFDYGLSIEAREMTRKCAQQAKGKLLELRRKFIQELYKGEGSSGA